MLTMLLEVDEPLGWRDSVYLELNPDVAEEVAKGRFRNGLEHYLRFGVNEPRKNGIDIAEISRLDGFWDEAGYLELNPDVAAAVGAGTFPSGAVHFILRGQFENRMTSAQRHTTRLCFDPWIGLEVEATGQIKPCCKRIADERWTDPDHGFDVLREAPSFRRLRRSLLRGDLEGACVDCHIRPLGNADSLVQVLRRESGLFGGPGLVNALPLRNLRVEVTSKCNLRCVYCAVSLPDYAGVHMPRPLMQRLLTVLREQRRDLFVMLNGHGEMTYHPDWIEFSSTVAELGFRTSVITNLAKPLEPAEADALAAFYSVQVSMDTVDADLLRRTRRHVKLSTITSNLELIRAAARARKQKPPLLGISCGVYDANYTMLDELVPFCIEEGIGFVTFWQLVKHEAIGSINFVETIESLSNAHILAAAEIVERTAAMLRAAGIGVEIAGEFNSDWRNLAGNGESSDLPAVDHDD